VVKVGLLWETGKNMAMGDCDVSRGDLEPRSLNGCFGNSLVLQES